MMPQPRNWQSIPMVWSIPITNFPKIALDVLEIIRFLVFESGYYVDLEPNQAKKLESHIFQIKKLFKCSSKKIN